MNIKRSLLHIFLLALPLSGFASGDNSVFEPVMNISYYYAKPGKTKPLSLPAGVYLEVSGATGTSRAKNTNMVKATTPTDAFNIFRHDNRHDSANIFGGSVALGYSLKNLSYFFPNRGEVEYSFRTADYSLNQTATPNNLSNIKKSTFQHHIISINIYDDFNLNTRLIPYIGAGIGIVKTRGVTTSFTVNPKTKTNTTSTAWNVRFGFRFQMSDTTDIAVFYKYNNIGNGSWLIPETTGIPRQLINGNKVTANSINVGVHWNLGDELGEVF